MGPLDTLNHLLNFVAPAAWMAVLLALLARLLLKKTTSALSLRRQMAINFAACVSVLVLGLWFFGRDGKMASYVVMAALCATSQWLLLGRR
jgi:hypothetical protein